MLEQSIDGCFIALDDVEDTWREARLVKELCHVQRCGWIPLARLQDERVAAGNSHRKHPGRHHAWKVERSNARDDTERLAEGPVVEASRDLVGEVAFQKLRNPAREFNNLDSARDLSLRIREHFAVLAGDDLCDRVTVLVQKAQVPIEDA